MWTPGRTVFVVVLLTVAGCDGPTPTEPGPPAQLPTQPSPLPQPGPSSGNAQRFELTGIVTDQEGKPRAGAVVTMGLWQVSYPNWPMAQTDDSGTYRIGFTATPRSFDTFLARAQVTADGHGGPGGTSGRTAGRASSRTSA